MSIRIATLSFGGIPGLLQDFPGSGFEEAGGLDPTFLNTLLLPPLMLSGAAGRSPSHRLPRPIATTSFPDRLPVRPATQRRSTRRRARSADTQTLASKRNRPDPGGCAICLEPLDGPSLAVLSCTHSYHRKCLFAVLTAPAMGGCSMVRCPLCRATVDRHDLAAMGYDVSPQRLALAARRCGALFQLASGGGYGMQAVSSLVQQCGDTEAIDGFLYNSTVLAIERALYHRLGLIQSLDSQLRSYRNRHFDPVEFVRTSLACHVEVLMRTAAVNPDGSATPADP